MSRLELSIAWRYLRSRRGSRLLSFISVIAIGGVIVGVSALIVIMGVMNGLQRDLRDKILIGSPDLRVLTYGQMKIAPWEPVAERVRRFPGVAGAEPFVLTQGVIRAQDTSTTRASSSPASPPARPVRVRRRRTSASMPWRATSPSAPRAGVRTGWSWVSSWPTGSGSPSAIRS